MVLGKIECSVCEIPKSHTLAQVITSVPGTGSLSTRTLSCGPSIEVRIFENADKIRGIGEPGTPPAAPALANAIFAATGQRLREMPFSNFVDFA